MGWTFAHRDKGMSNREYLSREFGEGYEILADATIDRKVWYAAVRVPDGSVVGFVFLLQWAPRDYHNFGYKDMSEDMGPVECSAPAKVLDLLTPTEHEYALDWRARCRANLAARAARPNLSNLQRGDKVRLARSFRFTNGIEGDTFTIGTTRDRAGRIQRYVTLDGYRVRLPRWRDMVAEVIPA